MIFSPFLFTVSMLLTLKESFEKKRKKKKESFEAEHTLSGCASALIKLFLDLNSLPW